MLFSEKKSKNFMFLTKCCVAPRGEGVCGNLNFSQKVAITPRKGGLRPPCQKFNSGEPHIEKKSLFEFFLRFQPS